MNDLFSQEEIDRLMGGGSKLSREEGDNGEEAGESSGINRGKLDLILDVPVKSRVVVGKTTKKLKELLDLKPGMIVETGSFVTDYVELMVNDNVIALGEVVVVGENYALRVKQIINPVERIRRLK